MEEIAASIGNAEKMEYDDRYILKNLLEGKSRDDIASEFNHKSYRTIDMYMRRHGYMWDSYKKIYVPKLEERINPEPTPTTSKVKKIISLFKMGLEPKEVAKKTGIKDHMAMAVYMKSKGYSWSSEKQNYLFLKGKQCVENENIEKISEEDIKETKKEISMNSMDSFEEIEKLLPMLEMIYRNKDKLAELLAINTGNVIPRYVVGGVTITKSLCMAHPLAELIKEFSKEKNLSQREIFEVALIEFLKKYGYENEVNALFMG